MIRITGEWVPMKYERLKPDDIRGILEEIHPGAITNKDAFYSNLKLALNGDFKTEPEASRFRGSVGFEHQSPYVVLRPISQDIPTLGDLRFRVPQHSDTLTRIAELKRGLVLVTGPTGSGKSTTLAAMINHIKGKYREHIITIEHPVEYVYKPLRSVIN